MRTQLVIFTLSLLLCSFHIRSSDAQVSIEISNLEFANGSLVGSITFSASGQTSQDFLLANAIEDDPNSLLFDVGENFFAGFSAEFGSPRPSLGGVPVDFISITSSSDPGGSSFNSVAIEFADIVPAGSSLSDLNGTFTFNGGVDEDLIETLPNAGVFVLDDRIRGIGSLTVTVVPESILLGDINLDGVVTFLDISPFIAILSSGGFQAEADVDESGEVNFLDISHFIAILSDT